MTHYLNFIEDDEDDIDDIEEIEEVEEEEEEEEDDEEDDEEVILKINKRLVPRNYTFYKIHKNGCESYIGATVNLYKRKALHKNCCNDKKSKKYNLQVYKYIRANGGYDSFDYEILDKRFCSKVDAEIYEGELMIIHKSKLNVVRNYTEEARKKHRKEMNEYYQKNEKKNECNVCNCFIKRDRAMKVHIQTKKHIKNLENRIKELEDLEKQNINNITINIQNLNINLPQD